MAALLPGGVRGEGGEAAGFGYGKHLRGVGSTLPTASVRDETHANTRPRPDAWGARVHPFQKHASRTRARARTRAHTATTARAARAAHAAPADQHEEHLLHHARAACVLCAVARVSALCRCDKIPGHGIQGGGFPRALTNAVQAVNLNTKITLCRKSGSIYSIFQFYGTKITCNSVADKIISVDLVFFGQCLNLPFDNLF